MFSNNNPSFTTFSTDQSTLYQSFYSFNLISTILNLKKPRSNTINTELIHHLQPRVHVSPRIIIVAVAVPVSPPDQHSPKLGHLASSQTVCNFNSLNFFLICVYFSPPGIDSFIHLGFGNGFFFVPTSTE